MFRTPVRRVALLSACVAVFSFAAAAAIAATSTDVQANEPQVQGEPDLRHDGRLPHQQAERADDRRQPRQQHEVLIAGANDEQRQPPCGPGPVRGPDVPASDCSFFPGVGTSGIYTSADGGATWTNRGLLDDQPGWQAGEHVSATATR